MHRALPVVLIAAVIAIASAPPTAAAGTAATPAPSATGTAPPLIYHIITRPLCSELRNHVKPAIGMMLQNDKEIGKGPALFQNYNRAELSGVDNSVSNGATNGARTGSSLLDNSTLSNPAQQMALLGMENIVSPIANNIIAIKKLLSSPAFTVGTGNKEDDKKLQEIKAKLLAALRNQERSLDLINGFVDTQAMGDLQHAGQEYIGAVNQSELKGNNGVYGTPTPFPGTYNPNQVGINTGSPGQLDLATIPGLTLGYNPVTRIMDALHWTIAQTQAGENEASQAVMESAQLCAGANVPAASPSPH